jgi:hypothetical protein
LWVDVGVVGTGRDLSAITSPPLKDKAEIYYGLPLPLRERIRGEGCKIKDKA